MSKPRILLSISPDVGPYYAEAVTAAGGIPVGGVMPDPSQDFAALLLGGGSDVAPDRFGQENCGSEPPDLARDELEFQLIRHCLDANKPILGICRGMQVLNVALGGTLIQDLSDFVRPFHTAGDHFTGHAVRAEKGSVFERLYAPVFQVNSFHHQAVDNLGEGFVPLVWSESGIVEGMLHTSRPLMGVQFHPERMTGKKFRPGTADGAPIFDYFLSLCQ